MTTRRFFTTDNTALYLVAVVVIVVAFLLLGGVAWLKDLSYGSGSISLGHLNWVQILISFGIGILVGWLVTRRNWFN